MALLPATRASAAPASPQVWTCHSTPVDALTGLLNPQGISAADVNRDGVSDLLVSLGTGTGVAVSLGQSTVAGVGNGNFGALTTYVTPSQAHHVTSGDFNDDGWPDLAYTYGTTAGNSAVAFRLNNGNGTFGVEHPMAGLNTPLGITVADFNEDGIQDLAVTSYASKQIAVYQGLGSGGVAIGSFASALTYVVGSNPSRIVAGDFNHDGILDLAVTCFGQSTNNLKLLRGQGISGVGDMSFKLIDSLTVGTAPIGLAAGDFNEDGNLDLAVSTAAASVGIVLTDDSGDLTAPALYSVGSAPRDLVAADLDMDGDLDVAVVATTTSDCTILTNNGLGTLALARTFAMGMSAFGLVCGDFEENGEPDLLASCSTAGTVQRMLGACGPPDTLGLTMLLPNGGEEFAIGGVRRISWLHALAYPLVNLEVRRAPGQWERVASNLIGGFYDWTVVGPASTTARFRVVDACTGTELDSSNANFGITNAFSAFASYAGGGECSVLATGDFNEDGIFDIAATGIGGNVKVFKGNGAGSVGDGTFSLLVAVASDGAASITSQDVNNDGILDLQIGATGGRMGVMLGLGAAGVGNGGFGAPTYYGAGTNALLLAMGDFNEDGILDAAALESGVAAGRIHLGGGVGGNGNATFTSFSSFPVARQGRGIVLGDFNEDGILDLACSESDATGSQLAILLGDGAAGLGSGTFTAGQTIVLGPSASQGIVKGDFDEDGITDLAVCVKDSVQVFHGNGAPGVGNGTFTLAQRILVGTSAQSLVVGDWDGDGVADLAVTFQIPGSMRVGLLMGQSLSGVAQGVFMKCLDLANSNYANGIVAGDFLEDGIPDLVVGLAGTGFALERFSGLCSRGVAMTLNMTSPNGGDLLQSGATKVITLFRSEGILAVDIDESTDGGVNWRRRASGVTESTFPWNVTLPTTVQGRIRIRDTVLQNSSDISNNNFTVCELFHPATALGPSISSTRGLASGDFNEDGILDLAVANGFTTSSVVDIYTGDGAAGVGDGTFTLVHTYPVDSLNSDAVAADVNDDGILDLVLTRFVRGLAVLLGGGAGGVGNGTFGAPSFTILPGTANGLAVADLDADGILDAATCVSDSLKILLGAGRNGAGTGAFVPAGSYKMSDQGRQLAIVDQNGDGAPDIQVIVAGSNYEGRHLFRNLAANGVGSGIFTQINSNSDIFPRSIVASDFNEDGIPDFALGCGTTGDSALVRIYLGTAGGSFTKLTTCPLIENYPEGMEVGDWNGDGILDIAVTPSLTGSSNNISMLFGKGAGGVGNGLFETAAALPPSPTGPHVVAGDFNEDNLPDLAGTSTQSGVGARVFLSGACTPGLDMSVHVTFPNGGDTLMLGTNATLTWTRGAGVAQVNVDVSHDGGVNWERIATKVVGNSFQWHVPYPLCFNTARIRVYDPSAVNRSDMSDASFTIICYTFNPAIVTNVRPGQFMTSGDFNVDGILDVATIGSALPDSLRVYYGNGAGGVGDGTFRRAAAYTYSGSPKGLHALDYDGDGALDLITLFPGLKALGIFRGLTDGGVSGNARPLGRFYAPDTVFAGNAPYGLDHGDLNADGILDLVVTSPVADSIFTLIGQGTFGSSNGKLVRTGGATMIDAEPDPLLLDLNGDGRLDVMSMDYDFIAPTNISLRRRLGNGSGAGGNGTFGSVAAYPTGAMTNLPIRFIPGDFNDDQVPDVLMSMTHGFSVVPGDGAGGFGAVLNDTHFLATTDAVCGDWNGDGVNDYAMVGYDGDSLALVMGSSTPGGVATGLFASTIRTLTGDGPAAILAGDFLEDGVADLLVLCRNDSTLRMYPVQCAPVYSTALHLTAPSAGKNYTVGADTTIRWTKGKGILKLNVALSRDNGKHWHDIGRNLVGTSMRWRYTGPYSPSCRLKIYDPEVPSRQDSTGTFCICDGQAIAAVESELPRVAAFGSGTPNPFLAHASFSAALPAAAVAEVRVYDVSGRRVRTLVSGELEPGVHRVEWNGRDEAGRKVGAGVYFVRARWDGFDAVRRVVRL